MMVLPEIDMPGHMTAAVAAYPELGNTAEAHEVWTRWGISEHVLNLDDATVAFCTDVLDEVVDVFPAPYVHLGGDECPTLEWRSSASARRRMTEEGFSSERELQGWFTARLADHLSAHGRTVVGWDELLEAGAPPGAIVMSWRSELGGIAAAIAGRDVVMTPQQWCYFDWAQDDDPSEPLAIRGSTSVEKVYGFEPVPDAIPPQARHRVLGAQCQLWTEDVPTPQHAEYMYFPRLCAFAEVVWTPLGGGETRSFEEFAPRLERHCERLAALGVNFRPLSGPTPGQARSWAVRPESAVFS